MITGPWPLGINNRQPSYALPEGTLRDCVNADLDNTGHAHRRAGYAKVLATVYGHSSFACEAGVFFMDGAQLKQFNSDNSTTTLGALSGSRVAYAYANGIVFLSDGTTNYRIVSGALLPWGTATPTAPLLAATAGELTAGQYTAAVTYLRTDGQESGSSQPVVLDVPEAGGVQLTSLPFASDSQVTHLRVYLSRANGTTLFHAATVANGTASCDITTDDSGSGKPLSTYGLTAPPPGRILREYNSRMLIASGAVLWVTEPYAYELLSVKNGYIQFEDDITVVEPVEGGVWVATTAKTHFLRGTGPTDFVLTDVLDYGAVFGTEQRMPGSEDRLWVTPRGVVLAGAGGQIKNLTETNVALGTAASGASVVREIDGLRLFISALEGFEDSTLAAQIPVEPASSSTLSAATATDFFTATVIPPT